MRVNFTSQEINGFPLDVDDKKIREYIQLSYYLVMHDGGEMAHDSLEREQENALARMTEKEAKIAIALEMRMYARIMSKVGK